MDLIESKAKGEEVVVRDEVETPQVADLMEALRRSVEETSKRREGGAAAAAKGERAQTDGRLEDLTKDQLYERAAEADISGRSSMTKGELIDALSDAA